jgi:hypothetical protein
VESSWKGRQKAYPARPKHANKHKSIPIHYSGRQIRPLYCVYGVYTMQNSHFSSNSNPNPFIIPFGVAATNKKHEKVLLKPFRWWKLPLAGLNSLLIRVFSPTPHIGVCIRWKDLQLSSVCIIRPRNMGFRNINGSIRNVNANLSCAADGEGINVSCTFLFRWKWIYFENLVSAIA